MFGSAGARSSTRRRRGSGRRSGDPEAPARGGDLPEDSNECAHGRIRVMAYEPIARFESVIGLDRPRVLSDIFLAPSERAFEPPMQSPPLWRFGPFEADAAEHRLRRDGEVVAVTRKSFALLATLLARPGKLFTKAELFDTVWAGTRRHRRGAVARASASCAWPSATTPRRRATSRPRTASAFASSRWCSRRAGTRVGAGAGARRAPAAPGRPRRASSRGSTQALADARAGQRQLVFVTGEAGIGKTALVEAFLERHAGSARRWIGAGPLHRAIRHRRGLPADARSARAPGARRSAPTPFATCSRAMRRRGWRSCRGSPTTPIASRCGAPLADGDAAAHAARDRRRRSRCWRREKPIVLWLEDLHWSDPSSLAVSPSSPAGASRRGCC